VTEYHIPGDLNPQFKGLKKSKGVPLQAQKGYRKYQEVKVSRFHDNGTGWW